MKWLFERKPELKALHLKKSREWAAKNKDWHKKWRDNNPERRARYQRQNVLRMQYDMELADYDAMLAAQGGVCAICKQPERRRGNKMLSVDHCHRSNMVRGLLCNACNFAIGLMKDSSVALRAAADYLEKQNGN